MVYFSSKNDRGRKVIITAGLAALAFWGQYIVDLFSYNEETLQESEKNSTKNISNNETQEETDKIKNSEIQKESNTNIKEKNDDVSEENKKENNNNVYLINFIGESHQPSNIATKVEHSNWEKDEDFDISGRTYNGGIKITIYNMFSALDGNESKLINEITSENHYALNEQEISKLSKEERRLKGKFVIGKKQMEVPVQQLLLY